MKCWTTNDTVSRSKTQDNLSYILLLVRHWGYQIICKIIFTIPEIEDIAASFFEIYLANKCR